MVCAKSNAICDGRLGFIIQSKLMDVKAVKQNCKHSIALIYHKTIKRPLHTAHYVVCSL